MIAILGAGGHSAVICDAILERDPLAEIVLFDDRFPNPFLLGPWKIEGTLSAFFDQHISQFEHIFVGIGHNYTRLTLAQKLHALDRSLISVIHPRASVSSLSHIEPGCFIAAGAVVGPFSRLNLASIVNTCASVDHDCHIGAGAHISPGAHLGGNCHIGDRSWIGIGSCVREGITVGPDIQIGAGSTVISPLSHPGIYVGTPAKILRKPHSDID
jgi:sugar O-acyltransferase (sialic acid O-acetyltransferase NeuD family)